MTFFNALKKVFGTNSTTNNRIYIPDNTKVISREYYNLLMEVMNNILRITNKLKCDRVWEEKYPHIVSQVSIEQFIRVTVIQDIVKLCRILSGGDIQRGSVEHTGVIVVCLKLMDEHMDPFNFEYESISQTHVQARYKEVGESILEMGLQMCPLLMTEDDEGNEALRYELALPTVLKNLNHPLFDEYTTALYRFATVLSKADSKITISEEALLKEIYLKTHKPVGGTAMSNPLPAIKPQPVKPGRENVTEILAELDELIGLNEVKAEVKSLVNFVEVQKQRSALGLKNSQLSYHCVFTGSPGTGKTTIARLIARIYAALDILETGQLVETDRAGLVAEYIGQTAPKVDKVVQSALGGILFIDEAYALAGEGNDYGKEAISALIKRMEDYRDRLVLVMAGYVNEMEVLIESNPGFKSRFNRFIYFPDYTPDELLKIFELFCSKAEYSLTDEAKSVLTLTLAELYTRKGKDFGNARLARNLFEASIENQSNRIAVNATLTKETLTRIEATDIPVATKHVT